MICVLNLGSILSIRTRTSLSTGGGMNILGNGCIGDYNYFIILAISFRGFGVLGFWGFGKRGEWRVNTCNCATSVVGGFFPHWLLGNVESGE